MDILSSGTIVKTKMGNIEGIITGATIRFNNVSYEISYFMDGEYKEAWLNEVEFTIDNIERQKIGFKG